MLLQLNNLTLEADSVENKYRDSYESIFPQALIDRIGKKTNEGSKKQSIAAYLLLNEILMYDWGISLKSIQFTENGKPYLENGPFISVAHSGNTVCAAVCETPIGVDIENIKEGNLRVVDRFFTSAEKRYILKKDSEKRFFTLWTIKEAIIKREGKGLRDIGNIRLNILFGKIFYKNYKIITKIHEKCVISVCFDEKTGR